MDFEFYIVLVFGLLVGSFLNVCIYRVPRKMSVINPRRSFCPKCKTQLKWYENVPVISWVIQLAKCKTCGAEISGQYPFVEILSMCAAGATYIQFGLNPTGVLIYAFLASLIVITFIDLEFKIIPDLISLPGITIGLSLGIVSQYSHLFFHPITKDATDSLSGMFLGGGFFYVLTLVYYWMTKKIGLGGGDVKLMAFVGALLGWESIAPTVFAGSICGSIIGIALMIFGGGGRHTEIPFGPWLSLGAVLYIFTGMTFFHI